MFKFRFSKSSLSKEEQIEKQTDKSNRRYSFWGRMFSTFFNGFTGYTFFAFHYSDAWFNFSDVVNVFRDLFTKSPMPDTFELNVVGIVGIGIGVLFDAQKALCARNINKAKSKGDTFGFKAWTLAFCLLWTASIGSFAYIGIQYGNEKEQANKNEVTELNQKLAAHESAKIQIAEADKRKGEQDSKIKNAEYLIKVASNDGNKKKLTKEEEKLIKQQNYVIGAASESKNKIDAEYNTVNLSKQILTETQIKLIKDELVSKDNKHAVSGFTLDLPFFKPMFISWLLFTLVILGSLLDGLTFLSEHSLSFVKSDIKKERSIIFKILALPFLLVIKVIDKIYLMFGLNNISLFNQGNVINGESYVVSSSENAALLVEKSAMQTRIFELENLVENLSQNHAVNSSQNLSQNSSKNADENSSKNLTEETRRSSHHKSDSTSLERQVFQQENQQVSAPKNDEFLGGKSTSFVTEKPTSFTNENRQVNTPKNRQVFVDKIDEQDKMDQAQIRAALKDKKVAKVIRLVRKGVKPSINFIHTNHNIGRDVTRLAFNVLRNKGEMVMTSKTSYKYIGEQQEAIEPKHEIKALSVIKEVIQAKPEKDVVKDEIEAPSNVVSFNRAVN